MNIYEKISAETKEALDTLVSTLPWDQLNEDDTFLGDLQIHVVSQLEEVILDTIDNCGFTIEGKTALDAINEKINKGE